MMLDTVRSSLNGSGGESRSGDVTAYLRVGVGLEERVIESAIGGSATILHTGVDVILGVGDGFFVALSSHVRHECGLLLDFHLRVRIIP